MYLSLSPEDKMLIGIKRLVGMQQIDGHAIKVLPRIKCLVGMQQVCGHANINTMLPSAFNH